MTKIIYVSKNHECLVDDEDYEALNSQKWCLNTGKYAMRVDIVGGKRFVVLMHRKILGILDEKSVEGDHINENKLDNRRSNLRTCTRAQNTQNVKKRKANKSGYKGVCWHKASNKWVAAIQCERKKIHIGLFKTKEEAFEAYCKKSNELHKDFSNHGDGSVLIS